MQIKLVVTFIAILAAAGTGGCSFMGDVMHAEGDYAHKIGNAFKRQGARRDAAKKQKKKSDAALAEN